MSSNNNDYWKANIALIVKCLSIWFIVSYLFGIVFVDALNVIKIGGYKLGFWFAQQGSIYAFVVLVFYYAKRMGDIDEKYNVHEK
ncbi:FIG152265: Sodium:solute symporter associated protein [uncultured Gammaproteobacteria bacterium]|nr:FIG152265: Sodium:solute symporter associated protein [uncultured Gammaproteobacteria bacterium]